MLCGLDASDTSGAIGILSYFFTAVPRRVLFATDVSRAERLCDSTLRLVRTHNVTGNPDDWRRQVYSALQFQQAEFFRTAQLYETAARDEIQTAVAHATENATMSLLSRSGQLVRQAEINF